MRKINSKLFYNNLHTIIFIIIFICNIVFAYDFKIGIGCNMHKQLSPGIELPLTTPEIYWQDQNTTYDFNFYAKCYFPINDFISVGLGADYMNCKEKIYRLAYKTPNYNVVGLIDNVKHMFSYNDADKVYHVNNSFVTLNSSSYGVVSTFSFSLIEIYCGVDFNQHKIELYLEDVNKPNMAVTKLPNNYSASNKAMKVGITLSKNFDLFSVISVQVGLGYELRNLFSSDINYAAKNSNDASNIPGNKVPIKHIVTFGGGIFFNI